MNQNIWGPHLWFSLHTISFNYPLKPTEEDKKNYKDFFMSMKNVIPCSVCKKNYLRHLNELPIDNVLNNRKDLVYWVIDLHNMVNGETGKKIWSPEAVLKKYEQVYGRKIILESKDDNITEGFCNIKDYEDTRIRNRMIINYLFLFLIILLVINLFIKIYKHK